MTRPTTIGWPVSVRGRDGNRIACQVAGPEDAQPIVLTSGIGCGPVFYRHIAPALARRHRIIYWDYRSHGRSGPAPDGKSYAIADHARDLEDVIHALTRRPPFLVGFSMGVQVTVEWARRWGESVPGFVFLLGMPCNPLRSHWAFGRRVVHKAARVLLDAGPGAAMPLLHPFSKATLRSPISYAVAKRSGLITSAFDREDYYEFIRYSSAIPPDAYLRCAIGVIEHDAVDCWRDLHRPTLYLAAEQDVLVPARECSSVSGLLPNGTYEELRGRSHAGTVEAGDALALKVCAFVEAQEELGPREAALESLETVAEPLPPPSRPRAPGPVAPEAVRALRAAV